jgi:hypothetical protein
LYKKPIYEKRVARVDSEAGQMQYETGARPGRFRDGVPEEHGKGAKELPGDVSAADCKSRYESIVVRQQAHAKRGTEDHRDQR